MQFIYENFTFPPEESFTVRSEILEIKKYTSLKSHFNFEIALLENCKGKRFVGDHIEDFEGTELVLLGSYLPHCWQYYGTVQNDLDPEAIVVHFFPDFLGKELLEKPETLALKQLFTDASMGILFTGDTVIQAREILKEMLHKTGLYRASLMLQLLDLLAHSVSSRKLSSLSYNVFESSTEAKKINRVFDYIFKNFREDISLNDVAEIIPMSTAAFCRFFKLKTNRTLVDFIKEIRIGHAAKLLMEGKHNVTETCYMSGYNNISNFNKHFKEVKGLSPRDFTKQYRSVFQD
ncbi:AraC family transcriptional regulator [Pedobacter nyackensis]|uniref:AraC-type DNA-binding protein n=1 Tax=Pedobacter nyackensis TaxID=475255 RepID=A0A1W2CQS3_9SPHI|nr:AraC family transcriptional regulator [Pedobacter nyackensis]SMC87326.1 AraC-type DNA-binding protein [Pedobacter nyackensis]